MQVSAGIFIPPQRPEWSTFESALTFILSWVPPLGVLALLFSIIYGALTIETAGANPEKLKKGWIIIRSGIIGFILLVFTPLIVNTIGTILGAPNLLT
jgi:hypothetical protein